MPPPAWPHSKKPPFKASANTQYRPTRGGILQEKKMNIKLNDEQVKTLEIIKKQRHYGIFFDMGVGKTALMLQLIEYLVFDKLELSRILIIAPATVANELEVWQDEIKKWDNYNYFDYVCLKGTQQKRKQKLQSHHHSITIMSDALISWWAEEYGNLDMFDMIIIDESSRFKSPTAVKFKKLSSMIDLERHRVYLLSGTPVPNGLEDIWSQIYLLDKGQRLGKSFYKFIDMFFTTFGYRRFISKANKQIVYELIENICVFASSDNLKLPPKSEEKIMLNFTPEKLRIYKNFEAEYFLEMQETEIAVLSKQNLINKCLQLANGCVYSDKEQHYLTFDDSKLNFVRDYSESHPDENILVFYCYRFDKARLLNLKGAKAIEDTKSKNEWNEGKIKLGIISPYSFQYGGNLQQGGATIIWFGLMWGLENYLQSNKRIWRQGQTKAVKIMYLMIQNTWDDFVYKALISKELDQNTLLEYIDLKAKEVHYEQ